MRRLVCLMLSLMLAVSLCACGEKTEAGKKYEDIPGLEDGILTVGMECAYAPYNWMQKQRGQTVTTLPPLNG